MTSLKILKNKYPSFLLKNNWTSSFRQLTNYQNINALTCNIFRDLFQSNKNKFKMFSFLSKILLLTPFPP